MSWLLAESGIEAADLLGLDPRERAGLLRRSPDPAAQLDAWIDACRGMTLEEPERGAAVSAVLVELAAEYEDPRLRARALSARCHAMSYAGRMHEASAVAAEAIEVAERSSDERVLGEACLTAVQSHNVLGLRNDALALASRAGELFRRIGDGTRAGTAEMLAGVVLRMLDRPNEAIERFDAASCLLADSPSLMAQLASNRAEALLDLGAFGEARQSFEAALAGFESAGQSFGVAIVLGNLADLASRRGELREGLDLFLRASERFLGMEDEPEAARLEAEAAELLLAIGDHREAVRRLEAAIGPLDKAGMQTEASRARMALGVALGIGGRVDRAIGELESARSAALEHNQARSAAKARALVGRVLLRAGRVAEAVEALRSACESEPAAVDRVRTELDLARALVEAGATVEAMGLLASAERACEAMGLVGLEPEQLGIRAAIAHAESRLNDAAADARRAMRSLDSVRATLGADRLRASVTGGGSLVYERAVSIAMDAGDAGLAFEAVERSAARSLRERSSETGRRRDETTARLEGDLAALCSQLELAQHSIRSETHIEVLRSRVRATEAELARRDLAARHTPRGADAPSSLDAVRARLSDRSVLLCIASMGEALATVAVRREGVELLPASLGAREARSKLAALQELIDRSLVRLATGRSPSVSMRESINGLLDELGDGILGDAAAWLTDRVGVCLPTDLSMLPIAALRVGRRAVVSRCTPVHVPSPSWVRTVPSADRSGLLVAGASDTLAPGIERELDAIEQDRPDALVLRGERATISAIADAAASVSSVHLACHAAYTPVDPMGSRVRLADGWHSARRIAELDLRGAEVVLGGCESGAVDAVAAGEQFGLVRAALLAGARTVLASRWRLHDQAAAELLPAIHSAEGSMEERLARLQAEAAEEDQDPALWGGMFAIGCVE
ncbi:MAG: CHAT domain-containing protein [Phycisphaerales bacterium]